MGIAGAGVVGSAIVSEEGDVVEEWKGRGSGGSVGRRIGWGAGEGGLGSVS